MRKLFLLIILAVFLTSNVLAENQVNLYFFYGQGCPHCESEKILLNELEVKYPTLNIERYEVYQDNDNRLLFEQCSALSGTKIEGVPTTFIDKKAHVGFSDKIGQDIESEIERCLVEDCQDMMASNETEVCETVIPTYNKEEVIGNWLLGLIGAIILFFIIKKSFFGKKHKRKGLSSKKKTSK